MLGRHYIRLLRSRLKASPLGQRLARGAGFSFGGAVTARVVTLAGSIFIARVLGAIGYGRYGVIQSTMLMFTAFAGFGLGATATKYVAQYRDTDPERAGRIIVLSEVLAAIVGLMVAIVFIAAAPWLANVTLKAPELTGDLRISAITMLFLALNSAEVGALSGFEAFGTRMWTTTITAILSVGLGAAGAYVGGVRGCIAGLAIGQFLTWVVLFTALLQVARQRKVRLRFRGFWREAGVLHAFSLPMFLCNTLIVPTAWLCNALLVNQPNGYHEMGLFTLANQWRMAVLFVATTLTGNILPIMANLYGQQDYGRYRKVVIAYLGAVIGMGFLAAVAVAITSPWIVSAYGKDTFHGAAILIVLLAFSTVLTEANGVVGADLTATGRVWLGVVFCVLVCSAQLGLAFLLIPRFGAFGLAVAILLAYAMHGCWQGTYLYRALRRLPKSGPLVDKLAITPVSVQGIV